MKRALFWIFLAVLVIGACEAVLQTASVLFLKQLGYSLSTYPQYVPYVENLHEFQGTNNAYGDAPEIWLFGGSTMVGGSKAYGSGAKNGIMYGTIPDELAAVLKKHHWRYTLRNFGQTGYNMTQERILFFELLRQNKKPDIVVFYDGANDIRMGFYPFGYRHYRKLYEREQHKILLLSLIRHARFKVGSLYGMLFVRPGRLCRDNPFGLEEDNKDIIPSVLEMYGSNIELIEAVCDRYKIKSFFIWQPVGKECRVVKGMDLVEDVRSSRFLAAKNNYMYLGNLFVDREEYFFSKDMMHIDDKHEGHVIIAKEIYRLIRPVLRK